MGEDYISSINPATLDLIERVAVTPAEQIEEGVKRARYASVVWEKAGFGHRIRILKKAQLLLLNRAEEMAALITSEMGRPFAESLSLEVEASIDLMGFYVRNGKKMLGDRRLPLHNPFFWRRRSVIHFEPLGVLGIISPWNWPLLIPLGCIVPALMAGNAVVFKPSEVTPVVGERIHQLFLEAGVPADTFQTVQGYGGCGRALVASSVDKIFFIGSTGIGKNVLTQASALFKKVILEMGGHDPAIVCQDSDVAYSSSGILWGGMNNCGQNCNAVERVYVHEKISDRFIDLLVKKTEALRIGNGMRPDTDLGPLATDLQVLKAGGIISKLLEMGGQVLTGGKVLDNLPGYFFEPTIVLWNQSLGQLPDEEFFCPIITVTPVANMDEAIELANRSDYGLAGSVWTSNFKKGREIAERINSGSVMVNDAVVSFGIAEANWTGIKKSGMGWIHGQKGLDEMVNMKYIFGDVQYRLQKFWWFPYGKKMIQAIKKAMDFLFHDKLRKRMAAIPSVLKYFSGYIFLNRKRKDKL